MRFVSLTVAAHTTKREKVQVDEQGLMEVQVQAQHEVGVEGELEVMVEGDVEAEEDDDVIVIIVKFQIMTLKKIGIGQNPWTLTHSHRLVNPHLRLMKQTQQILILVMKMEILMS